jgi:ubiquinone/menaquinone biosynthesis C-methylase UbiE
MNQKRLVATSYDRIGEGLLRKQHQTPPSRPKRAYLERLTEGLPRGAWVLDLGCGPGMHSAWLSERFRVIGVDISRGQLALAKERAPRAAFLLADMCSLQFKPGSFDAIAAMYSIIHVPREEHERMLKNIYAFLKPGGRFFAVLGANEWEGTEANWLDLGADMWWSHFDADTGLALLRSVGFSIAQSSIEPDTGIGTGAHLFALAEKAEGSQG